MEIKFWDKEKQEYEERQTYYVNSDGAACIIGHGIEEFQFENIEPHFYIDGERIA